MFKRLHHRQIARVLHTLNGPLLLENRCLFGGGTAIALRFGEYRESVDIDFLVSDLASYRNLRQLLTAKAGVAAICHATAQPLALARDIRADQYGIRTVLQVDDTQIKLEIVLEGRIELAFPTPADSLCGVATLTLSYGGQQAAGQFRSLERRGRFQPRPDRSRHDESAA